MTVVYFVRHGRTDWNHLGIYRGRIDRPLDDVGIRQAELVRDYLSNKGIKKLYASPLKRTLDTLSKLSARMGHKPIFTTPDLIDIDYGDWQGVKKDEIAQKWPDLDEQWREDPFSVTFPNGESLKTVQERAVKAVNEIVKDSEGLPVAVCSHRVVLKAVFCAFVGSTAPQAFYTFNLEPASVSIVRFKKGLPLILKLNETYHLRGDDPLGGPADF